MYMPLLADVGLRLGIAGQGCFSRTEIRQCNSHRARFIGFRVFSYIPLETTLCSCFRGVVQRGFACPRWLDAGPAEISQRRTKFRSVRSDFDFWMYCVKALNYLDVGLQLSRVPHEGIGQYGFSRPRQ